MSSAPLKRTYEHGSSPSSSSKRAHVDRTSTDMNDASQPSSHDSESHSTVIEMTELVTDDPFTHEEHVTMDADVLFRSAAFKPPRDRDLTFADCVLLVTTVVHASRGRLDERYTDIEHVTPLVKAIRPIVQSAWKSQSFNQIRRLKVFQKETPAREVTFERLSGERATEAAWKEKYVGDYHLMLISAIDDMVADRTPVDHGWNYVPIVQSSGMGKSRLIDEVSKTFFCIPICIRAVEGVPPVDVVLRDKFIGLQGQLRRFEWHPDPEQRFTQFVYDKIRIRYTVLLACIFKAVVSALRALPESWSTHEGLALAWYNHLHSLDTSGNRHRDGIYREATEEAGACNQDESAARTQIANAAKELYNFIPRRRLNNKNLSTRVLISFDECHTLSSNCFCLDEFKDRLVPRTPLDALLAALDEVRYHVFGVLLSTRSDMYALSRPAVSDYDNDLKYGARQPPYVELPFDSYRGDILTERKLTMDEACEPEFLCRFGRPLWWTRVKYSSKELRQIFDFAMIKLTGHGSLSKVTRGGAFAALSTLLCLDLDPARQLNRWTEAQQVASHMRVVYSVPEHREYLRSGSSSEPVLAEVAARIWNRKDFEPLEELSRFVREGLVSKGDRGELAGKYILIRAMQEATNNAAADDDEVRGPETARFSRWVRLCDYLEHLLPQEDLPLVLQARPYNRDHGPCLREVFENAWVHFNHFARADNPSMFQLCQNGCLALARGLVWQCPDRQMSIDFAQPVLFLPPDVDPDKADLSRHTISWVLYQLNNSVRDPPSEMSISVEDLGMFEDTTAKPFVVISMELTVMGKVGSATSQNLSPVAHATPSKLRVREAESLWYPARNRKEDPRSLAYWIAIQGCSPKVFHPKIVPDSDSFKVLLASRPLLVEHPRKTPDSISAVLNLKPYFVEGMQTYFETDSGRSEVAQELVEAVNKWNEATTAEANANDEPDKASALRTPTGTK